MEKINLVVVFLEGILSFFSPCILPILPIYLSMLSNSSIESLKRGNFTRSSLFKNTLFFVMGISTTFFILGSSVKALSVFFNANKNLIMIIGGVVIIAMGLFYMGAIKSTILSREKRFNMKVKEMNSVGAFLLGFTFSFGWTPCIGPILASVLIMASGSSSSIVSSLLIVVYTLGFILPFILVALFYNKLFNGINKIKTHMGTIKKVGGCILIISGLLMLVNGLESEISYKKSQNSMEGNQIENKVDEPKVDSSQDQNKQEDNDKLRALDFTLYDQYGKEHKLSDYKGKTIFLNFWATWCPPCRGEMPDIEELYKEYNYNKDDVVILGIASPNLGSEGDQEYIEGFLNNENYTFTVIFDKGGSQVYQYGISAFPSTFIINKDGYIERYIPGAMNKETMKKLIEDAKNNIK